MGAKFKLTEEQGIYLVKLARQVIENKLGLATKPEIKKDPILTRKCGVFVTLNRHREGPYGLRGCIGVPYPIKPLVEAVIEAAEGAAFHDPRFPPVRANEMDELTVEVSVLTPPELLVVDDVSEYPRAVKVGEDGLIISKGWRKGLLLPQVPVEWGWDSRQFLSQCCVKAGLPPDEWMRPGTEIYKFQAILFKEEEPRGKISQHIIH